ncbi:MAG: DUF362 domain-containing protein [Candidatus Thorarchaeota archaeon]
MARPLWFVEILKKTFPRRSMLAKATKIPLIGRVMYKMLFEDDDIMYLPKDSVIEKIIRIDRTLEKPTETALPSEIVHYFIERAQYHWIMNKCICRDAAQCKDYPIDFGCLFLGEAVLDINPQLGRLVTKEEAHEHARRCREAGLVHLVGRNKLDTQWLNVSPGDRLLTICNCCPCCCLWKMLPDVSSEIGRRVTKMPGISVHVNDNCVGCGTCTDGVCFVDAITLIHNRAVINDECRGCGRCVEVCPEGAIEMTIDNAEFLHDSIRRIDAVVDVE